MHNHHSYYDSTIFNWAGGNPRENPCSGKREADMSAIKIMENKNQIALGDENGKGSNLQTPHWLQRRLCELQEPIVLGWRRY